MNLTDSYCKVDWAVFWAMMPAVAVAGAAIFAFVQILSSKRMDEEKNTINVFDEMDFGDTGKALIEVAPDYDPEKCIRHAQLRLRATATS